MYFVTWCRFGERGTKDHHSMLLRIVYEIYFEYSREVIFTVVALKFVGKSLFRACPLGTALVYW